MISEGERKLKRLLDKALPDQTYMDNYRSDWLKNPATGKNLELDRYYPNQKLGIEYNGSQHRKRVNEEQWRRDKLKKHLCGNHGVIRLVFYRDELSLRIVQDKLQDVRDMRSAWAEGKSSSKK